jgi:hypothetical protein
MTKLVLAGVFLLLFCGRAKAQVVGQLSDGNTTKFMCTPLYKGQEAPEHYCLGFVSAAEQVLALWQLADEGKTAKTAKTAPKICIPIGSTTGQIVKVFRKYLESHPEELQHTAGMLFLLAMHEAFPCEK